MATEYLNVLRISGRADDIEAVVSKAAVAGETHMRFANLVPPPQGLRDHQAEAWIWITFGTGEPFAGMEAPKRYEENDLQVASYTFVTKKNPPFGFAEKLAQTRPELIVALASVAPDERYGEIRVYGNGSNWTYSLASDEVEVILADEESEAVEEDMLDALESAAASVVDDYEKALSAPPKP